MTNALNSAIGYLKNEYENNELVREDAYTVAILSYTMALAEDDEATTMFETLKSLAKHEGM